LYIHVILYQQMIIITEAFHYEHIEDTICTIDTKNVISTEEIIANTWSENVNEQHDNDDHVSSICS
jgi:hypothetical protein